jgi:hypothetical protein
VGIKSFIKSVRPGPLILKVCSGHLRKTKSPILVIVDVNELPVTAPSVDPYKYFKGVLVDG